MQSLKVLVGGITGGIVFMGAALAFILRFTAPPLWTVALLLVLGLAAHTLIRTVGYRAKPIPPQTPTGEASTRSMGVFRSLMMMRMALAESVALIGIVLAFVTPQRSWLVFAVGAAVSLLLIALHVWPSRSSVDRVVASLEQDGARTGLHETLGLGGAVQDSRQPPGVQS
jgi:phosphatidylglycerophosphate synthase